MQDYIIKGPSMCLEDSILAGHCLIVSKGIISDILPVDDPKLPNDREVLEFSTEYILIPGMIDMHIHGAMGADIMDADPDAIKVITEALLKEGVTGFLATTMTAAKDHITNAIEAINKYKYLNHNAAEILGIHLEGPFLSKEMMGAQNPKFLSLPDLEIFNAWHKLSNNIIKQVTIAPELQGAMNFIKNISQTKTIISIGHTNASCKITQEAIDLGAHHATHLYNAMSDINHRQPGAALALLLDARVMVELIADGVHLGPEIIRLTSQVKPNDKIVLVTDAMRAKCLGNGTFDLGGQEVIVNGNTARLKNGKLAGSVLKINKACANMLKFTNLNFIDIVKLVSSNPAKALNMYDKYGSIRSGKLANLVLVDKSFSVKQTFLSSGVKI